MSGIAALLDLDGSPIPESEIEQIANVLKPYGPDRQKILIRGNAAFAFCLDEETPEDRFEHQPLLSANNRFVTLFDGRIDNRTELSEALGIGASELLSMPDSLIVFRLFDRWGERAFERILGVFAIIIMDLQDGRLICARDHMGLRVLHYFHSDKRFAVATTPQALFALRWVPRSPNYDKVADTLCSRGLNDETTYYKQIYRVAPGSIVALSGTTFSKTQFWDTNNIPDVKFKSDQDYVEAFQDCLSTAIKVRLRSNGVPCATISGGLDSSSIAVTAADILAANGNRLNTFTAVPEVGFNRGETLTSYFDETPYVRQIAQVNPNVAANFVPPRQGSIVEQIAQQIGLGGGFSAGIFNGLWVMDILTAARSAGHNVMLGGDAGNFTMSHHGRCWLTELMLKGRWLRLINEIRSMGDLRKHRIRKQLLLPLVPAPLYHVYKNWRRARKPSWYDSGPVHPEFAERSGIVDRAAREYLTFDPLPPRNCRQSKINDLHAYCDTADWLATVRANFRVDLRLPAVDRRLVEFCIGIPNDQYLRDGRERWLIRRAMNGRLPEVVLNNKKRGIQASDWYPRLTRERDLISAELKRFAANSNVASVIDVQRLIAILDNWPDRQPPDFSTQETHLRFIPEALGAAYFIESVTGPAIGR